MTLLIPDNEADHGIQTTLLILRLAGFPPILLYDANASKWLTNFSRYFFKGQPFLDCPFCIKGIWLLKVLQYEEVFFMVIFTPQVAWF